MQRSVNQNLNRRPNRTMLRRTLFLMAVCGILAFCVLAARLYVLQIRDHEKYEELAISQQLRETGASAERGTIYDCNMNILAMSANVENVYLSPAEIEMYDEDPELIAQKLSEILGVDYDSVLEKTRNTGSWYVTVAKKIEKETADKVREFKTEYGLKGVRLESDTKRYYPYSSLACHVIGFVGTDNYGLDGLEAQYDSALCGTSGKYMRATNAYGTDLLFNQYEGYTGAENGLDLVTTIDLTIQHYVEKALYQAVEDYDIQNGAGAIAMDVNTGKILAMASIGGYDLNNFLDVSDEAQSAIDGAVTEEEKEQLLADAQRLQWRNKTLSDTYEPGSTFKIITLSMALEEGKVSLEDSFFCGGNVQVQGRTNPVRCWKTAGHGSQTLTQAVQHSCNVAFVNIGMRVGAETFYKYCDAFGFLSLTDDSSEQLTAKTGIDLGGESGSIWWSRDTFCSEKNKSQLAAASFGQTFTITPLQLITAVSACVNGGYLMQPYVAESLLDSEGNTVYNREPTVVRQVISEETSSTVCSILEQVVGDPNDGTGRNAAVSGYRIGGKTGTSEKVSYEAETGKKEYIVSFIGFAPADDPQIALLVLLDSPSNESGIYVSGGQMAAPTVGKMFADILPYMGIEPVYDADELEKIDKAVPELEGLSVEEAKAKLSDDGFECRLIGSGGTVTDQLPAANAVIADGSTVIIYAGAEPSAGLETMPDLRNMSYAEAAAELSKYGLFARTDTVISASDSQRVFSQSIVPGTPVKHGTIIEVTLLSEDESMLGKY